MVKIPRKRRKPPQIRYSRSIRVRLPVEVDRAVRAARRHLGISLSAFVRAGIEAKLVEMIPRCVEIARDPTAKPGHRLKTIEFLAQSRRAWAALHKPEVLPPPKKRRAKSR